MSKYYLSIQEIAKMYGKSRQSVWRKVKNGEIPYINDQGGMKIRVFDAIAYYGEPQSIDKRENSTLYSGADRVVIQEKEVESLRFLLQQADERIKDLRTEIKYLKEDKDRLFGILTMKQLTNGIENS